MNIVALLLAAGGSSRMGSLKQVLPVQGEPMVRHSAIKLLTTTIRRLVVVTGNKSDTVAKSLDGLDLDICHNPDWQSGIGCSIRSGVHLIDNEMPDCDCVLIALADQPMVPAKHFQNLIQRFTARGEIIASTYQSKRGVPVIFGRDYFQQLLDIASDKGAAMIIEKNAEQVQAIELTEHTDIDSPADYQKLINLLKSRQA